MRRVGSGSLRGVLGLTLTLSFVLALAGQVQAVDSIYLGEIMARAWSAQGTLYAQYLNENVHLKSWRPDTVYGDEPRVDCSGFIQKVWQVPSDMYPGEYQTNQYNTGMFASPQSGDGWQVTAAPLVENTPLVRADAMVWPGGPPGHIVMYVLGTSPDSWQVIDASGSLGVKYRPWPKTTEPYRTLSSWKAIRRYSIWSYANGIEIDNSSAYQKNGTAPKYYVSYSSHTCQHFGDWQKSSQSSQRYGPDYQHEWGTASGTAKELRWTPHLSQTGYYIVKMRWPANGTYATSAQVQIRNHYGLSTKWVNQTINGGIWVTLGTYYFSSSYNTGTGSVTLSTSGTPTNQHVIADAVRFEYVP